MDILEIIKIGWPILVGFVMIISFIVRLKSEVDLIKADFSDYKKTHNQEHNEFIIRHDREGFEKCGVVKARIDGLEKRIIDTDREFRAAIDSLRETTSELKSMIARVEGVLQSVNRT